ncbi:MAG: hypothetical protein WA081_00635 [Desulfosalsimonadaceae bacterium]
MSMCDICGKNLAEGDIQSLTEEQVVRATSAGFVPSELPLQGFVEMFGTSLSKGDHWRGTVQKYKGTGAKWGVCIHCRSELLNFLDTKRL